MFRLVEYFNTSNNGENIENPSCGVHYKALTGGAAVGVDTNGYKYVYPIADATRVMIYEDQTTWICPGAHLLIKSGSDCFFYYTFTCKFQNTPPSVEEGSYIAKTHFMDIQLVPLNTTPAGLGYYFKFIVLQYDSDGFGTMKNGVYLRHEWAGGLGSTSWRIVDDFNLTDLYTFELKCWTNRFNIRVLQNNEEITNETYYYADYYSSNTDLDTVLDYIMIIGDKTYQATRYYYWEYGLYDIDCSEGESNKLYIDGTVIPNATIYFLGNDSSSGTYQKVIGTAVTDADGSYTLPSGVSPPYIAFGTTPSGYGFCVKVDS